jgi:hypothetical protein
MDVISSMSFPVLAFTPNGVMPYSRYENFLRVMKHEFDQRWFDELEVVDSSGRCAVVHGAKILSEPVLARLFGRMVEVRIDSSEELTTYDVAAVRSRVLELLSLYPAAYQSAGIYDSIVERIMIAETTAEIVRTFLD